jgi:ATP-binding cassette subfamily B protein
MDLLLGLLLPTDGRILVDGQPLDAAGVAAWQLGVAHVPQSIFLADDTLAANIAFGTPPAHVDPALVERAAARAS